MNKYLFEYEFNGATYCLEIIAETQEEAESRLIAMREARYEGLIFAKIPFDQGGALLSQWPNLLNIH